MSSMTNDLPIQKHIPQIQTALETRRCAVILAPPGAGKTTRVPLALLNEPWLANKKIMVLEPRRLAARSCAVHMAGLLKEKVGQTVGYQVRLDRKIGPETRIEVVTEGIFTRKIQNDPSLDDIGLIIFDEFHERHIHSDLGLALTLESFEVLRDDLRVLVMSATLDVTAVSQLMGDAPVIASKGKSYPVQTTYVSSLNRQNRSVAIEIACASVIKQALSETSGDMLVFLPGVREIKRLASILEKNLGPSVHVFSLYGNLSQKEQAMAFVPSKQGEQKIVLATSIAETSITIEGVRVVIDSGLMRVPRFSPETGMTRLETVPVSKASADQRRGRAGRTAPGMCYRLWSEYDHGLLKPFTRPEILSVDLTQVVLELAAWGVSDPRQLKWLDPLNEKSFERARFRLEIFGALTQKGRITPHGKKMVAAGLHPRLSHMIIKGNENSHGFLACRIAAFLSERDFVRFDKTRPVDPDIRFRLDLIEAVVKRRNIWRKEFKVNKGIVHNIIAFEKKLAKDFKIKQTKADPEKAGALLALAYPDRIAKKRNLKDNTFLMASGKRAFFMEGNSVSINEYIVAVQLDGNLQNAKIFLAAPYLKQDFVHSFKHRFKCIQNTFWDKKAGTVKANQETMFEKLVIQVDKISDIDQGLACDILVQQIQKAGLDLLPWTKRLLSLKERAHFLRNTGRFPDLPDVSDNALKKNMPIWLNPFLSGVFSLKQLGKLNLESVFFTLLTWEQQQVIEKNAPTHIRVPSGSKKPLKYTSEKGLLENPILEVRLQEMFGQSSTPKIAGQSISITLHLLSPAGRPVQITKDLESFWKNTYKDVKKDMMGRYPKHFWPDDPMTAMPTNRAKPRKIKH